MPEQRNRRDDAAFQAYCWARVAGGVRVAYIEWEAARQLSNVDRDALNEWQQWLLDHLDRQGTGAVQQQAKDLAELWVRVAAVQTTEHEGAGE